MHPGGLTMFRHTMQEVSNIEQFCPRKFIENKTIYIYKENSGPILVLLLEIPQQVGFNENVFMIFRPKLGEILNFEYVLSLRII